MKNNLSYNLLAIFGILLWWGETAYFGWNKEAESTLESMLDITAWVLIIWGIAGNLLTNVTIQKVTNVTTRTVEFSEDKKPEKEKK